MPCLESFLVLETPPTGPHTSRTALSQILASARLLAFAVTEVLAYTKFETVSELREERDVLEGKWGCL